MDAIELLMIFGYFSINIWFCLTAFLRLFEVSWRRVLITSRRLKRRKRIEFWADICVPFGGTLIVMLSAYLSLKFSFTLVMRIFLRDSIAIVNYLPLCSSIQR